MTNSTTSNATVGGVDTTLTTRYTYDEGNHNLLSAGLYSSADAETALSGVSYTYDTDRAQLKRITRTDGQKYNFLYDIWGRITDIKVGSRLLSHSEYTKTNSNDTQLLYTEYGNGTRIYYTYDCGGALTGAYAKEVALTKGYQYLFNVWLM